jgi:hypothetical protein
MKIEAPFLAGFGSNWTSLWARIPTQRVERALFWTTVEDHKPRGIAGYNLGQDSRRGRYLMIPALICYQAVQNLLPDALLVLGGDVLLAPFLNGGKPVLEGVHVAWRPTFCLSILAFHFFLRGKIHFPIAVSLWQSNGKAEKFDCDFWRLDALRVTNPRVGQVRLPNERNQSISYFLRVFRVTGQILVQKPLLIKKPPY